jgi:hypothetical protein
MAEYDDQGCMDHAQAFAPRKHADIRHVPSSMPDHKRGAGHPAKHSPGKLAAQLNPDHGPHKGAGRHR